MPQEVEPLVLHILLSLPHQLPHQATLASALVILFWGCLNKGPQWGGLRNRNLCLRDLEARSLWSNCQPGGFAHRPVRENLSGASPWAPGGFWPSLMALGLQKPHPHLRFTLMWLSLCACACPHHPLFVRIAALLDEGSLTPSLLTNCIFNDLISKSGHILRY